ncbi:MAG: transporter substrate-binding domain-containing protein [Rhodoferax sp.]|nr:transporter substrate-binding domain-containing protein [Rhodoferax sp.]
MGASLSHAVCSRAIIVPAAPTGFNVKVTDDGVSGVYPDWLREVSRKAGCQLQFPVVPRARADSMTFVSQQADVLTPASQNQERDQKAQFVHLVNLTPSVITLSNAPSPPKDLRLLTERSKLRAALVRGYSWGDEYDALVQKLIDSNRVDFVNDLATVGRMLRAGRVDFTILPPTLLYSALQATPDALTGGEFRFSTVVGLPKSRVGAYLSRQTLSQADLDLLSSTMIKSARDGSLRADF